MKMAPLPANESERLEALGPILQITEENLECFSELTALAANVCHTDMAVITLVSADRQKLVAGFGMASGETQRDVGFCSHTILEQEFLHIPDTLEDERFFDNPFVTDGLKIRFYCGFNLNLKSGFNVGALCVIDTKPRELSEAQMSSLRILAKQVVSQFELRCQVHDLFNGQVATQKKLIERSPFPSALLTPDGKMTKVNQAWQDMWQVDPDYLTEFLEHYNIHTDQVIDQLGLRQQIDDAFSGQEVSIPAVLYDPENLGYRTRKLWVKTYLYPILKESGELKEILLVYFDVTKQVEVGKLTGQLV